MPRPLKIFMRGKRIALLQEILYRKGYPMQDQKGVFGVHTRDAIKDIQKQHGLKPSGQVEDELFQLIQQGQPALPTGKKSAEAPAVDAPLVNQQQFDALIRLLISKGMIKSGELEAEMTKALPAILS